MASGDFTNELNSNVDDNVEPYLSEQDKVNVLIAKEGLRASGAYNTDYNALNVHIRDNEYIGFNLYLCKELGSTTLSAPSVVDTFTVTVTSPTGALAGDCINIRQGGDIFQSLIKNVATNTITFASPMDKVFTAGAEVCFGEWNLNGNGSSTPLIYKVCPPPDAKFHIRAISLTMNDTTAMDDSLFGSLPALTNGLIVRRTDGVVSNYFLISNNAGFYQYGYTTNYPAKVPSGTYGFQARKNLDDINGTVISLDGATNDELQIIVQDNLTGLTEFAMQVHGHIVESQE